MNPRSSAGSGWRWITTAIMAHDAALPRDRGHRHVPVRHARAGEAPPRRAGSRADRLREGRPARAARPDEPQRARRTETSTYPLAEGLPELREAVAGWCGRRFGVSLDADTEIVPTYGSKEAIFLLAQVVVDRDGDKPLVVTTQPGYPVPDRGAMF